MPNYKVRVIRAPAAPRPARVRPTVQRTRLAGTNVQVTEVGGRKPKQVVQLGDLVITVT